MKKIQFKITSVADALIEYQELFEKTLDETLLKGEEYNEKYNDYILKSQLPNQVKQMAEANELLRQEPIYMEFKELENTLRKLKSRKEVLKALNNLLTWGEANNG